MEKNGSCEEINHSTGGNGIKIIQKIILIFLIFVCASSPLGYVFTFEILDACKCPNLFVSALKCSSRLLSLKK